MHEPTALLKNLSKRVRMTSQEVGEVTAAFECIEQPRNGELQQQGYPCHYLYYVASGACKSYVTTRDGKEKIVMFALPDWWITDIDSLSNGGASTITIKTLMPTVLYRIAKPALTRLLAQSTAFESAFRYMMQHAYIREQRRTLSLITDDAVTRYQRLINEHPRLEQIASQKDIAAYLGITPEFLSATKRQLRDEHVLR